MSRTNSFWELSLWRDHAGRVDGPAGLARDFVACGGVLVCGEQQSVISSFKNKK